MPSKNDPYDPERLEPYFEALGRFAHYYAATERSMQAALRVVTNTPQPVGRIFMSAFTMTEAIDRVRRYYEEIGKEIDPLLARAFPKLKELTTQRNTVLHHGIQFSEDDDAAYVTDRFRKPSKSAKKMILTPAILNDMAADTITAYACLRSFYLQERNPDHEYREGWEEAAQRPWRFSPPPALPDGYDPPPPPPAALRPTPEMRVRGA